MQPAATILIVKSGISNHAASGILDELCLSKFGTFHAACPQPADNFRTYVQHSPCSRIKHNRAKPMFELASALFSIADVNEFRFARFYIVYEEARLVLLGSPSIVCELPDTPRGLSKRGKTQHSMPDAARKNYLDFTPKNPPLPVTLERYGSLIFLSTTYLLLHKNVCCGIPSRSRPDGSKLPFYDTFSVNFCISFSSETFSINAPSSDSF